jgi:hypothetical protein
VAWAFSFVIRSFATLGGVVAAVGGCGTASEPRAEPTPVAQDGVESTTAAPAPDVDVRDIFVIPRRGDSRIDRLVRLDASFATTGAVDVAGSSVYGTLAGGGDAMVVLAPFDATGGHRPELFRFDARTLTPKNVCDVGSEVAGEYKSRPTAPFYVGADVPDRVVVPLRTVHATHTTVFDVTLRVVDVTDGTWFDAPAPTDAGAGVLFTTPDGSLHAAVTTRTQEVFDVDLINRRVRGVTRGPCFPVPVTGETPVGLRGLAVRADEGYALVVNVYGAAVRVALADGAVSDVRLPVAGLGTDAFVEDLAWSAASRRFALGVLRPGDPENSHAHVVLLDGDLRATGVEITTPTYVEQTLFSPRGTELIVALHDGSLRRYRVSDGALLASSPAELRVEAVLGVR